jgi:HlyD family secretion protein
MPGPTLERLGAPPRHPRVGRTVIAVVIVAALLVGAGIVYWLAHRNQVVTFETIAVSRHALVQTVTATGTVNPQDTINVGTQVSGTIADLYVDFNSRVHAGQVLAKIDPVLFVAAADQARGALAQSEAALQAVGASTRAAAATANSDAANAAAAASTARATAATFRADQAAVAAADADVVKARSALVLAQTTVDRDHALLAQGFVAQSQADTDQSVLVAARSAYESAVATARQVRAQAAAGLGNAHASASQTDAQRLTTESALAQRDNTIASAQAQRGTIAQVRAALAQAQINLQNTVITSPVDGTVIQRNISVGQTVAASFQTPTLFTIARNLRKMEVDVAVGEPDIGGIAQGQTADFSVLAYPARVFHGYVFRVDQNPTTVANVVTYDTVVYVDNRDGALRPGMTADASIHEAKTLNDIVVPLEALTYTPSASQRPGTAAIATIAGSQWGQTLAAGGASAIAGSRGRVHVLVNGKPHRVPVEIVLVAGTDAAIRPIGEDIPSSARIIVADDAHPVAHATVNPSSPFGQQPVRTGPSR